MTTEFEKCARWILEGGREGWIVCHGMVVGKEKSDHFSHCWLEFPQNNQALTMSAQQKLSLVPADVYRSAMSAYTIDEFTPEQLQKLVKTMNSYGPFDRELRAVPRRVLH